MIPKSELEAWQRALVSGDHNHENEDAREFMLRMIEQLLRLHDWAHADPWQNNRDIDDGT